MLGSEVAKLKFCGVLKQIVLGIVSTLPTNYGILIGADLLYQSKYVLTADVIL